MTEPSMLDRCTRAVMSTWDSQGEVPFPLYSKEASAIVRAVLDELSSPDEAMIEAGEKSGGEAYEYSHSCIVTPPSISWQAMIAQAKKGAE